MSEIEINGNIAVKPEFFKTDYSEAINSEGIKPHLEAIYKRWDDLGFTEGLNPELKKKCAYAFEQLAQYLIYEAASDEEKEYYEDTNFETIGFPIIRRTVVIIDEKGIEFKFNKFIEYYNFFNVNEILDMLKGTGFNGSIDEEAEAVATVSMMIENMFENPNADPSVIKEKEYERIRKYKKNKE
jgi:hypothetical protein